MEMSYHSRLADKVILLILLLFLVLVLLPVTLSVVGNRYGFVKQVQHVQAIITERNCSFRLCELSRLLVNTHRSEDLNHC